MGGIREVVAVIVAADSPTGRVAKAIDELTAHLPPPKEPWACPLCSIESWPCSRFDTAAHQVMTAGLRLRDWIPNDLHPRLWPQPQPSATPAPREQATPQPETWTDEEPHDG
jgi:hypothetical protein